MARLTFPRGLEGDPPYDDIKVTPHSIRTKIRCSMLSSKLNFKGHPTRRPKRESAQMKHIIDFPVTECLEQEREARILDAVKVLTHGWRLVATAPVEVWTGSVTYDAEEEAILMNAKVVSNDVETTCGFIVSTTPQFNSVDVVELEEKAKDEDPVSFDGEYDVSEEDGGFFLYVLPYADDGTTIAYGTVKQVWVP